jgi:hypothetical protein
VESERFHGIDRDRHAVEEKLPETPAESLLPACLDAVTKRAVLSYCDCRVSTWESLVAIRPWLTESRACALLADVSRIVSKQPTQRLTQTSKACHEKVISMTACKASCLLFAVLCDPYVALDPAVVEPLAVVCAFLARSNLEDVGVDYLNRWPTPRGWTVRQMQRLQAEFLDYKNWNLSCDSQWCFMLLSNRLPEYSDERMRFASFLGPQCLARWSTTEDSLRDDSGLSLQRAAVKASPYRDLDGEFEFEARLTSETYDSHRRLSLRESLDCCLISCLSALCVPSGSGLPALRFLCGTRLAKVQTLSALLERELRRLSAKRQLGADAALPPKRTKQ